MTFFKKNAVVIFIILGIWSFVSYFGIVEEIILPSPEKVIKSLGSLFQDSFFLDIKATTLRVLSSIILSCIIGIPLGLYLGYKKSLYKNIEGLLHALRSIPATVLFPLFLIIIGVGETSMIVLATYPCVLIIIVNTVSGCFLANPSRLKQAEIFELSPILIIKDILLFEALPAILDGIRISISYALVLIIAVEMFIGSSSVGVGYKIYLLQSTYLIPETYAAIMITGLIGILFNLLFNKIEKKLLFWHKNFNENEK